MNPLWLIPAALALIVLAVGWSFTRSFDDEEHDADNDEGGTP